MSTELKGLRVAILVTDGFEQVEMTKPREALQQAGAETTLISPNRGQVQGWNHDDKGDMFPVDKTLDSVRAKDFDAYLQPGGVANPDRLRMIPEAVQFARDFYEQKKPMAVICHGPWMLVEADVVRGKTITSWPSLKTDIRNAGGKWVDQEVVVDGNIVTSRKPDDIPAFNREMINLFSRSVSEPEAAGVGRKQR
ncbi:MAG: pfpI, protease [Bryobacterales bacterium]|jgi:protease I|nr:pfpI, protease [Bryobacterales bacterium]